MPKKDLNQLAKAIVDQATGKIPPKIETARAKAGRLGGVKGGAQRAKVLTSEQRSEIAKKAAAKRWGSGSR
jgi:hypothetical protein